MTRAAALMSATLLILPGLHGHATAQVTLQFKFPEGRATALDNSLTFDQTLTINGQAIPTKSARATRTTTRVGAKRDDGTTPVTQTIDSIRAELSLPGGIELTIDSDDPKDPEGELPQLQSIRQAVRALDGISYVLLFGPDNTLTAVEGLETAIPDDLAPEVAEALRRQINPETIKKQYQQAYDVFPKEPVVLDQTWDHTDMMPLGDGQTMTFERRYQYLGTIQRGGKTLDRIGLTALSVDYALDNPDLPLQVKSSDLKVESSEGEILFDREAGEIVESKNSSRITGTLVLTAGGQELPAELDLSIVTSSSSKPASP